MMFINPKNQIVQTIAVLLPLMGLFLFMLYNSCAFSGFCKNNFPTKEKNVKLLNYLRNLDYRDIKKIEFYLYTHTCVIDSHYLNSINKEKINNFTKENNFKSLVISLGDLSNFQPAHQPLGGLILIEIELNNGNYMNFDVSRESSNTGTAYIDFGASLEIEWLEGLKIFPHSFKFKSDLLYAWIKTQINEMKGDVRCCDCQLSSGDTEPYRKERGKKDELCFLCIM